MSFCYSQLFNMVLELILWNEPFNFFSSDIGSAFAIWYLCSVSAIVLVFRLPFSFCNLVFVFSFCNFFFVSWSNPITSRRYLFSFCDIYLVSAIWYFVFRYFCIMVFFVCWLWLRKEMICFSLWVWGLMERIIGIGVM
jgi:hypothetical protein